MTDEAWALVAPILPAARPGGRPRTTNPRVVINAIFYLLRTGCQWRLLPHEFPAWVPSTTISGVGKLQGWVQLHRTIYEQVRVAAGREACPSVVIMDGQSVKTTERGGTRGFAGHKRVNGRKRHILVDTLGFPIASRVERADTSDRCACSRLLAGLAPLFPRIHTVMADAGHESRNLAGELLRNEEWKLLIVKRANQSRWNVSSAVRPTNQMLSKPKL